jgi:hypothetical protein
VVYRIVPLLYMLWAFTVRELSAATKTKFVHAWDDVRELSASTLVSSICCHSNMIAFCFACQTWLVIDCSCVTSFWILAVVVGTFGRCLIFVVAHVA